jgi:hypothetical protein
MRSNSFMMVPLSLLAWMVISQPVKAERVCQVTDPTGTPLNVRDRPNGQVVNALRNGREVYIGLAERICNLYRKRLLAELRVAQVQGNLLKSLKTLAPSLSSTNVPQSRATPNLTRKLRVSLAGEIIPRQSLGYHGQSNSLVRI